MYVFAYGSLLSPRSLHSTLPDVQLDECTPALVGGFRRSFDVEFPNDGSQSDKRYVDATGQAPARVLLCNIRPRESYDVAGVCIPVDDEDLERLKDRERRYDLVEVTCHLRSLDGIDLPGGPVLAFVGRGEFTRGSGGVASRSYVDTITSGARYWDSRAREFSHHVMASTLFPARIEDLRRVDLSPPAPGYQ